MNSVVFVLVGIALAATLAVLMTGVFGMARGGEFNRKYGNLLMRWRVILQGCAVALLLLAMFLANG
ncbi:MAG: twin transmembrane helix small protein [Kiloniellales bacterium]|jgi:hypothetical protein